MAANGHHQDDAEKLPDTLDGQFAELILKNLIDAFHTTSVLACTPDGVVLFANRIAANGFKKYTSNAAVGMNLLELTPENWALERIEIMKQVVQRKHPLLVIEIISGTRLCSTITPIQRKGKDGSDWMLLVTVEQITPMKLRWLRDMKGPDEIIDANVLDLGPLSVLTKRELEVLALMGQGLRQKQIADLLHRSVSTIDRHRERIGEKLGVADRIELVAMAREAALEFSDATKTDASFGLTRFDYNPE